MNQLMINVDHHVVIGFKSPRLTRNLVRFVQDAMLGFLMGMSMVIPPRDILPTTMGLCKP